MIISVLAGALPVSMHAQQETADSVQLSYRNFEQKVLDYSQELKQSREKQVAMKKAMQTAKASFFPTIDLAANYRYRINDYEMPMGEVALPIKHDSYDVGVTVAQPIYAGGNVVHNYRSQKIQSEIANLGTTLTEENMVFAAERSYWSASAQKEMYEVMCRYTNIVGELVEVLEERYAEGLISKTDLIQMQVRLKDAEVQRSTTFENYMLSVQAMNILMGKNPTDHLNITDSISTDLGMPALANIDAVLNVRPDYAISKLGVDQQRTQVKLSSAKYNPTVSVGYQGVWGTQMININGDTKFNSTLFLSFKLPLLRSGARFKSHGAQKALLHAKQFELQSKQDQISKELASSWTSVTESKNRIELAKENCDLADENLEMNTFSYTEGKLSVLDVLSAQLTWIQAYTNLVQSYYKEKMAQAQYKKAAGLRYNL